MDPNQVHTDCKLSNILTYIKIQWYYCWIQNLFCYFFNFFFVGIWIGFFYIILLTNTIIMYIQLFSYSSHTKFSNSLCRGLEELSAFIVTKKWVIGLLRLLKVSFWPCKDTNVSNTMLFFFFLIISVYINDNQVLLFSPNSSTWGSESLSKKRNTTTLI
jgi:hypothetical protein